MKQESELWNTEVMLKTQPLCTGAESNLGDRVLGEAEKNSFIVLPGKAGHSRLLPLKTVCPHPAGFGEEFYTNSSRVGLLIRLGCVQGLHSFNLVSGNLFSFFFSSPPPPPPPPPACHVACGIPVPQPGTEPRPLAVSPNH